MASLTSKLKIAVSTYNAAGMKKLMEVRGLTTKTMPNAREEPRHVLLKYLDGKDNGIVVLGLNRPEGKNSFSKSLVTQMSDALASVRENDQIRVLIMRSLIPKIFCAGADLRERGRMMNDQVVEFVDSLRDLMCQVESIPAPVITAIDGFALGGGLELALAADIRTAASEAKMGLVETKLAIIPGAGGTQRLPRIVGPALAKELIYTARILDGEKASSIGLVNRSVPQNKNGDAAYQEALSIAREILPNGPIGVR